MLQVLDFVAFLLLCAQGIPMFVADQVLRGEVDEGWNENQFLKFIGSYISFVCFIQAHESQMRHSPRHLLRDLKISAFFILLQPPHDLCIEHLIKGRTLLQRRDVLIPIQIHLNPFIYTCSRMV